MHQENPPIHGSELKNLEIMELMKNRGDYIFEIDPNFDIQTFNEVFMDKIKEKPVKFFEYRKFDTTSSSNLTLIITDQGNIYVLKDFLEAKYINDKEICVAEMYGYIPSFTVLDNFPGDEKPCIQKFFDIDKFDRNSETQNIIVF